MDSALTLGAGTLTAAMLSGAMFGYKTMWLLWVSMGLGLFMMATNIVVTSIARYIYGILQWSYSRPFAANIMYLSPFHFLGRSFNLLAHGDPMSPLDFIWILYFIPLIIFGFRAFKGVYPDLLIKETA